MKQGRAIGQPDRFIVVNGPEDGTEFPVIRAPFHIGSEPSCRVSIRLDSAVRPLHALATVVSDGYRLRRLDRTPLFVDGKRAGMLRSRIVRSGGTVQVGQTLLVVACAPDGLARRSRGIVTESDLAWFAKHLIGKLVAAVRGLLRWVLGLFGRLITSWLAIGSMLFLLYVFWSPLRWRVNHFFSWLYYRVIDAVMSR